MIEKEKNVGIACDGKLTLQEYHELSLQLDEVTDFNDIKNLDPGHKIYAKLEYHLTRIYDMDFEDLNDDEREILLLSLMRFNGKIGPR